MHTFVTRNILPQNVAPSDVPRGCVQCNVRELCLPIGIDPDGLQKFDALVAERLRLKKGEALFRAGDSFVALHALRAGSCKTTLRGENGREQVAGYHLQGDIVGLDGIGTRRHAGDAVALEDSEVCVLPLERLEDLARHLVPLQKNLHKLLSNEVLRGHNLMLMLGSMRADERLALFLLDLSERYRLRGFSRREFVLRLTRDEIGSLLGLKLETISRQFSRFQAMGLIHVQGRRVKLLDIDRLKRIFEEAMPAEH